MDVYKEALRKSLLFYQAQMSGSRLIFKKSTRGRMRSSFATLYFRQTSRLAWGEMAKRLVFERWHSIRKRFKWWLFWCWWLYEIHISTCIHHECSILEFGRDSYQIVHNTSLIDCLTWVSTSCTYDSVVRLNTRLAIEKQIYRIQRKEYSLGEWITWKIVILKIIPNIQTFLLVKLATVKLIIIILGHQKISIWNGLFMTGLQNIKNLEKQFFSLKS